MNTPGSLNSAQSGEVAGVGLGRKDSSKKLIPELKDKDAMARWTGHSRQKHGRMKTTLGRFNGCLVPNGPS